LFVVYFGKKIIKNKNSGGYFYKLAQ